jgi:uncharacterized membrane protein
VIERAPSVARTFLTVKDCDVVDNRRMFTAALIAIMLTAFTTATVYVLLVGVSLFVILPSATQSAVLVAGLLFVIFVVTFVVAFRTLLDKFRP